MSFTSTDPKYNTPLIPASSATLVVHASTRISASAALVFRTLRNTETWRDWNLFVPRVTIRSQPAEKDHATDAEMADLVINTSILGSMDSQITDGAVHPSKQPAPPPESPTTEAPPDRRVSTASGPAKRADGLSGAQRYEQSQASRRASTASGASGVQSPPLATPSTQASNVLAHAAPATSTGKRGSVSSGTARRKLALNALYGEPSVRLQLNTTMTFHCRMHLPTQPDQYKTTLLTVTEVSRPDDPLSPDDNSSPLARVQTHTLSRSGVYRIVWGTDHKADKTPKFVLTTQRVTEIRPITRGDGKEECEITTWECMKGITAKGIKAKHGQYLTDRFQEWVEGLGKYCEAFGGAVDRKDFQALG